MMLVSRACTSACSLASAPASASSAPRAVLHPVTATVTASQQCSAQVEAHAPVVCEYRPHSHVLEAAGAASQPAAHLQALILPTLGPGKAQVRNS